MSAPAPALHITRLTPSPQQQHGARHSLEGGFDHRSSPLDWVVCRPRSQLCVAMNVMHNPYNSVHAPSWCMDIAACMLRMVSVSTGVLQHQVYAALPAMATPVGLHMRAGMRLHTMQPQVV
jgi:hypothetical protein